MESYNENQKGRIHASKSTEANGRNNRINLDDENNTQHSISKSEKFDMLNKVFLTNSSFNKHTKEYFITRFQIILILKESNILNEAIILFS